MLLYEQPYLIHVMNLENFDQKSTIIINTAHNYASENNYAYLTPLNILEVMIKQMMM